MFVPLVVFSFGGGAGPTTVPPPLTQIRCRGFALKGAVTLPLTPSEKIVTMATGRP